MPPSDGETVAALLTPLAPGAIAVIGLRGGETTAILRQILRRRSDDRPISIAERRPTFCEVSDDSRRLDDAVVVLTRDEHGDSAELNVHGGVRIAQRVLLLLERLGARIAGGDDFVRGTANRDVIEDAVDAALLRTYSRRLGTWLLFQRAHLADYLRALPNRPAEERAAFARRSLAGIDVVRGLRIAIVGPPNAGKSTLANRLIGHERILTSDQPGTTRDWVDEQALIEGWPVTLIDTAGIRETECGIEAESIRRGRERAQGGDLCLVVIDGSQPIAEQLERRRQVEATLYPQLPRLIAVNKSDLSPLRPSVTSDEIAVSALLGTGLRELERRIAERLGLDLLGDDLPAAFLPQQLEGADGPIS